MHEVITVLFMLCSSDDIHVRKFLPLLYYVPQYVWLRTEYLTNRLDWWTTAKVCCLLPQS